MIDVGSSPFLTYKLGPLGKAWPLCKSADPMLRILAGVGKARSPGVSLSCPYSRDQVRETPEQWENAAIIPKAGQAEAVAGIGFLLLPLGFPNAPGPSLCLAEA